MKEAGSRSANSWVSTLRILHASRSIKRLLLSEGSPSRLNGRKCESPAALPVLFPSKTGALGDDYGCLAWAFRIRWLVCFVLVTMVGVVILGSHSLHEEWTSSHSFRCSVVPSSTAGKVKEETREGSKISLAGFSHSSNVEAEYFKDEMCWSRRMHWLYRRSERMSSPSPLLTQAFEKYASLHGQCTNAEDKKWENFPDIYQSLDNTTDCKYVIYLEGVEGLGNRLLSLVSAYTYALATGRVLLVDSRKNIADLLCEPFQGSSWILPTKFPFDKIDTIPTLDSLNGQIEDVVAVKLNLRHIQSRQDQTFFCAETQEQLGKVQSVVWLSNQYYVTRLLTVPAFWKELNPLFDDPSRAFTQLSRHLLLPQNAIWAKIERIYQAYLAGSRKVVGLQVRTPHESGYSQQVQDMMMKWLWDDNILPKTGELLPYRPRSLNVDKSDVDSDISISIFVASLQREYHEALKALYIERGTEDGSLVSVHTVASEGVENGSFDQSVKALIDMWLLSFSDTLVTSAWSTFGYVAQGLGAVYPYIVNTDAQRTSVGFSGQSTDPCTHFPFLASSCGPSPLDDFNSNSTIAGHAQWMEKHLVPCQDEPHGLQLV